MTLGNAKVSLSVSLFHDSHLIPSCSQMLIASAFGEKATLNPKIVSSTSNCLFPSTTPATVSSPIYNLSLWSLAFFQICLNPSHHVVSTPRSKESKSTLPSVLVAVPETCSVSPIANFLLCSLHLLSLTLSYCSCLLVVEWRSWSWSTLDLFIWSTRYTHLSHNYSSSPLFRSNSTARTIESLHYKDSSRERVPHIWRLLEW